MRLRTFNAPDMPAAMNMVREALGDDAIIVSSKEVINGKRYVSVTAALDDEPAPAPAARPATRPAAPSPSAAPAPIKKDYALDNLRHSVHTILRFHNVPELFIAKMLQCLSDESLATASGLHRMGQSADERQLHRLVLETMLSNYFNFSALPLGQKPTRLMLVGSPGIGKTLTVAKLAARLTMEKMPLTVITTDNKRAGGIEQLQAFTNILQVDMQVANGAQELQALLAELPAYSHVLIDTAGCNPFNPAEFTPVKQYCSLPGVEPVLVMAAGGDSLEAVDMIEQFAELPIKRMLISQADSTRRFGGILAAAAASGLALSHISGSSSIVESPQPADAKLLAHYLLRYQDQALNPKHYR